MKYLIAILCAFHYTFAFGFTFSSISTTVPPFPGDETPTTEQNAGGDATKNAAINQADLGKEDQQKPQENPSSQAPQSKTINLHQSPLMLPSSVMEAGVEPEEPTISTEKEHKKIKKKKSSKKHHLKKKKKKGKKNKKKANKGKHRKKHFSKKKHHSKKKGKRLKPKKAKAMQENNNDGS